MARAASDPGTGESLGRRVKALRTSTGRTIKEIAERSGLSAGSISKIENDQLSPTYDSIVRLARGLDLDIAELFSTSDKQAPSGRRSVTRNGEGVRYDAGTYVYEMLNVDLVGKRMVPLKAVIKARQVQNFDALITHEGEEVLVVLSGEIELHTDFYAPMVLRTGDCAYFDSTMGHACTVRGIVEAEVFWVCSSQDVLGLVRGLDVHTHIATKK